MNLTHSSINSLLKGEWIMYQKYVKDVLYHAGWCIFFHYPLGCSENCLLPANMFDISGENFFFFF